MLKKHAHFLFKKAIARVLRTAGFKWEVRRQGDLTLGLWRKKLRRTGKGAIERRAVVIPGFGDSPLSWLPIWTALIPFLTSKQAPERAYTEFIFLDFPGFSGWLSETEAYPSMDLLMSSVGDVLDDLQPTLLFGHSLGGWLAGNYWAEAGGGTRPKRQKTAVGSAYSGPEKIILACPAGVFESLHAQTVWEDKFRRMQTEGFEAFRPEMFGREPIWFGLIASQFAELLGRGAIRQFMDSVQEKHLLKNRLHLGRGQVFLLFCDSDRISPPTALGEWQRLLRHGSAIEVTEYILPHCGHAPQVERPVELIAQLSRWI